MNQTHLQPFPVGSRVRVISGRYAGKTGLLLRFFIDGKRPRAWVRSDAHGTEVTFDVDELALLSLPQSSDQRSETSDQRSETVTDEGRSLSDQRSETSDQRMDARCFQASADLLHAHLNDAIALLHALGAADGWLDSDRKQTSKTYPRYRWREDGALRSRALAEWEVQVMRDRLRRGRLLRALLEYLQDEQ